MENGLKEDVTDKEVTMHSYIGYVIAIKIIDDIAGTVHITFRNRVQCEDQGDMDFRLYHHSKLIDIMRERKMNVPERLRLCAFEKYFHIVRTICKAYHSQKQLRIDTDHRKVIQNAIPVESLSL